MFQSIKSKIYIIITLIIIIFCITIFSLISIFYVINLKNINKICNYKLDYWASRINTNVTRISKFIENFAIEGNLFLKQSNETHRNLDAFVYNTFTLNSSDILFGGGLFFEPYVIGKDKKRLCSYAFNHVNKDMNIEKDIVYLDETYESEQYDYLNKEWYKYLKGKISHNHAFSFTKPYISNAAKGLPVITFGAGIFDNDNKLIGIALGDCLLDSVINKLKTIAMTEHSFILFADKTNDSILVSTYNNNFYRYIGKSLKTFNWYSENLKSGDTFKFNGTKYISFSRQLLNDMVLYVNIPTNELYSNLIKIFKYTIAFTILVIILIFLIMKLLLSNNIEIPIMHIIEKIQYLSEGNLDVKMNIDNPKEFNIISNAFNNTIENLKNNIKKLDAAIIKEHMNYKDLQIANTIQSSVLLKNFPPYLNRNEFDIYASMIPAKQVGGDFYDFFFTNDKNFVFLIADVSDKGVPAALFMMKAKSILKTSIETTNTLKQAIEKANKMLCVSNEIAFFVTAFIATLNTETGVLKYVNAGHNAPLIRENGNYKYLNTKNNMALGISDTEVYTEREIILHKDDAVFLYTDGVTETKNSEQKFYGTNKLQNVLNKMNYSSSKEIIDEINKDINNFSSNENQYDDVTMLSLIYNGFDANTISMKANVELWPKLYKFLLYDMTYKIISKDTRYKVLLSSEEIFTNISKYAYDIKTGYVWIKTEKKDNSYKITFSDYGKKYNPLEQKKPSSIHSRIEEREIGGLGIFLVKNIVNEINYVYEHGQNKLSITFNL